MRKIILISIVVVLALGGFVVYSRGAKDASGADDARGGGPGGGPGGGGPGGGPWGGGPGGGPWGGERPPMPVEFATVSRAPLNEVVLLVGNLIGAATVQAVPKVNGRLESVNVKLGDPVRRGQMIAKVEDSEIKEQVRQAQASFEVSRATIRQREADLKLAQTNLERSRSLLERQLLPKQTYDDVDARYQAALAQLDLARAQFDQATSRLDELRINLSNTVISSPVDGFVAKRFLDPGASVSPNAPVAQLVDIRSVRMVANLVEKDVKRVTVGTHADVEVDAFPGETFSGQVSRVAPVFDPATRTAEMEIEVPNSGFRLKPGMYARVRLTVSVRPNAIVVPSNAVVILDGKPGVFVTASPDAAGTASPQPQGTYGRAAGAAPSLAVQFIPVETGIREGERIEILSGLHDGARVITTGAGALKDGDKIVVAGPQGRRAGTPGERGAKPGSNP